MRPDTRARCTLLVALALGLVPVRAWEQGEIDTASMAVRLAGAMVVTWLVMAVVSRVMSGYRNDTVMPAPANAAGSTAGRRAEDQAA